MWHDFFDSKRDQHIPESFFNSRNRFRCTRNRIRPEQHISDSVGKGVEDLPADIVNVVGRRIGLNPGSHIAASTNVGFRERIKNLRTNLNEFSVGHESDNTRNDVARESITNRVNFGFTFSQ